MSAREKTTTNPPASPNTLRLGRLPEGKSQEHAMAECGLSPVVLNACTSQAFSQGTLGVLDITETVGVMSEKVAKVNAGDLSDVEATLTSQAATLDTMFNELARRASLNMGDYIRAAETYMRLALKAQSQCRATLETLAEIKNPRPVAFVKQANFAHGPQQINNGGHGDDPHARGKKKNLSNEQLEAEHELLPDTRASQAQSRVNPAMETVAAFHRPQDRRRESS